MTGWSGLRKSVSATKYARLHCLSKSLVRNFSLQISIYWVTPNEWDWDNLGYGLGDRIIAVGFLAEQEMFFSKFSRAALGPMQFPTQRVCGTLSLEANWSAQEAIS